MINTNYTDYVKPVSPTAEINPTPEKLPDTNFEEYLRRAAAQSRSDAEQAEADKQAEKNANNTHNNSDVNSHAAFLASCFQMEQLLAAQKRREEKNENANQVSPVEPHVIDEENTRSL